MECFKESGLEVVQNKGHLCKNNTWNILHCHNVDSTCTDQEDTRDSHRHYIFWIKFKIKKYTVHTSKYTQYMHTI